MSAFSKKKIHRRSKSSVASLNLTSLVDIFTIILLFLLMNYSVESGTVVPTEKLKLPVSTSTKAPENRLVIQVSSEDIIVEGISVVQIADVLASDDPMITPLFDALNNNTKKTEFIAMRNETVTFTGDVILQGDRKIPFILLEKIMYTCGQAGYGNISLAVISNE